VGMALQWSDNCYRHHDFSAAASIVNTPLPGNTSVRAPGVIASVPCHESLIEGVAEAIGVPGDTLREVNMYVNGDTTPTVCGGITLGENGFAWNVPAMWAQCKAKWQVAERRSQIAAFNAANRWRKRGLSLLPIKYNIDTSYYSMSSSVRIFGFDGTVHVAHGGCEVGQGIHTKVAQAVAYALGCPLSHVTIGDTSTLQSPNSNGTGGSGGSESCVRSVLDACSKLNKILTPYRASGASGWAATIAAANKDAVCLHAAGWEHVTSAEQGGKPFDYATQGVGCVEVELDALTGEIAIRRADVLMDQGTPLNPLIDLGQVEGGFMMALGYYMSEEVLYSSSGEQLSLGTWQYKPPAVADIPLELNIAFVPKSPNRSPNNVLGSKASAEPPMALGAAAFYAARDAIKAVRADGGVDAPFACVAPLTVERIQQACIVDPAQFTLS